MRLTLSFPNVINYALKTRLSVIFPPLTWQTYVNRLLHSDTRFALFANEINKIKIDDRGNERVEGTEANVLG